MSYSENLDAMHISLDNISFYSHPPAKPPSRAFPASCWKPYQTPPVPAAVSQAPLSRPHYPGTTSTPASDARPDASPRFRAAVREDACLSTVRNVFDIELERTAMAQDECAFHETDPDMHRYLAHQNRNVTDIAQIQRTSSVTEYPDQRLCPLVESTGDSDTAFMPAASDLRHSDPPATSTDRMGLYRDSTLLLGTCDERDKDPTPPEVTFTCTRISQSPSPDLLGNVHPPKAAPGTEAIMCDESVVDNTKSAPGSREDGAGDKGEVVATIQGAQDDSPSVREASPINNERNKSSEERQAPGSSCFKPPSCSIKRSKAPLTSTRSLRPRPNAVSTWPGRLPAVSVVIPIRRAREIVASTRTNPSNGARDRATHALTRDTSPFPERSSPKARERARKRSKRVIQKKSASINDMAEGFTSQSPNPPNGGSAVTLGKTQEIFGRGVLRIQSHGPRNAYFMTFLPEVTERPSTRSPSEMPPDRSLRSESPIGNEPPRQVVCKRSHKGNVSTACEDGDAWSTRYPTKSPRNARYRNDRNDAHPKRRRRLPWSSDEVNLLLKLRRDEKRPWSEVVRLFSDRYPGRSPGSIQVYWSTTLKKARRSRTISAAT